MKPKGIPLRIGTDRDLRGFARSNRLKSPKYRLAPTRTKGIFALLRTKR